MMAKKCVVPVLMISLASMITIPAIGSAHVGKTTASETQVRTVTKSGLAHVNSLPRIPKPKLFRSNPLRKFQILSGTDPYDAVDDEDYIVSAYRRSLDIKKPKEVDADDLPEHIRWRLFLARQMALMKYREVQNRA